MERIEQELLRSAGALVVEPPLIRRVVKAHRGASGLVPHPRCYMLARAELMALGLVNELGVRFDEVPDPVVLVARASRRVLLDSEPSSILTRYWRAVFHARVHLALDAKAKANELDAAALRERIDRIGQIEFDEIRAMLRHDDLVLPPHDDREVYVEFAAVYLELRYFAPGLLVSTFPGIARFEDLDAMFAEELEVARLLDEGRPPEVPRPALGPVSHTTVASSSTHASFALADAVTLRPASPSKVVSLLEKARRARAEGNDVGAVLAAAYAATVEEPELRRRAEASTREALSSLGARLNAALAPPPGSHPRRRSAPSWTALLAIVGDRAAVERATRFAVEARLLYALQLAALAHERPQSIVDVAGYVVSRGKRPVVRALPATRELRVAQRLREAAKLVRHVRVPAAERKLLARLLDAALADAEENVRDALRSKLHAILERVGLVASTDPERLAREKLVEELLDVTLDQGFLGFGALRDALSRNQLKLPDLADAREFWDGDPLLCADALLDDELDGVYRSSEVYLRAFQKVSSVPFGTELGRRVTLYVALPIGAAAIVLEALGHFGHLLHLDVEAVTPASLAVTSLAVFGLVHSAFFRRAAMQLVELVGLVLSFLLVTIPRMLFARPTVRRWFALPQVRFAIRRGLIPALAATLGWYLLPTRIEEPWLGAALGFALFLATSVALDSRVGVWLEDVLFDQLAPGFQVVSRQWLPGLVRSVGRFFEKAMDLVDRAMYRVDEALRFRQGQSQASLYAKGAAGFVWAGFAYVIRFYVTLLIEPFVNPLKHFPVVVVADKLMLAYMPRILDLATPVFAPLGVILGGFLAWMTMFLSPSIFGFLAWELKENFKLYRATRPGALLPAMIGHHGETMRGLLVVGMHSGTLPKLYERLRRAAQREDDAAVMRGTRLERARVTSLGSFREGLHEVEQAVRRFVERELVAVLSSAARWTHGELLVEEVELSSNRIRVRLRCPALGREVCELRFEEQSSMIVATMAEPGFVCELTEASADGARLFENALAGLYQRAEVDLVREQLEAELGAGVAYDIADGVLLVWPGEGYETEVAYRLERGGLTLRPEVTGTTGGQPLHVLDARSVFFRELSIQWDAWVSAWSAAAHPEATLPRLVRGTSLLRRAAPSDESRAVVASETAEISRTEGARADTAHADTAEDVSASERSDDRPR
ncbi:MAG: hypothetical protein FJ095_10965 [Deltaproteobacteria bacterium]|nr:hypothetical protein [Deltaproteobacteria bacterium]